MHLFFAITKMGIGHVLGEPLFDSLEIRFPILQPEKMILLRLDCVPALATMAGKNPC
jgi:hypothetical protein